MANTGTFRSAINGFNRQDVMDYLESASQRYEALKKERNELDRMRTEQQARVKELEGIQEEAAAIKEQAAQESLRASLEAVTRERDDALARPTEDPAVAEALRSEVSALQARLAEIEAKQAETVRKAEEYDSMRDRIATLELNASRRAADIEEAARSEARSLIEQAEQQAGDLRAKAEQDAADLLDRTRQENEEFLAQRDENYRLFRENLQGAAAETEASTGFISEELQRLGDKLKGIVSSLTDTSRRFDPEAKAEETTCCEGECAPETAPAPETEEEVHHCHG